VPASLSHDIVSLPALEIGAGKTNILTVSSKGVDIGYAK
jgi:hypothetical protein